MFAKNIPFAVIVLAWVIPVVARDPAAPTRPTEQRREGAAVPIPEKGGGPPPDFSDERYGPHDRNVFDLWRIDAREPTPLLIFIHGGGFSQGDKRGYWTATQTAAFKAGIAPASIN